MSKVILITGASMGIGQATARHLAARGYRVFGTSRSPAQADSYEMLVLNVDSDESVRACVQAVIERAGRIDVLINNAGQEFFGAVEETSIDQVKRHFETNVFGAIRMMTAVLPLMREQGGGHIINLSSTLGFMGAPLQGLYAAAKHAIEGYSESLWYELQPTPIHVSLVQPGFINTGFVYRRESPDPLPPYAAMYAKVYPAWIEMAEHAPSPEIVAHTIRRIIESDQPRLHYLIGWESLGSLLSRRWLPFEFHAEIIKFFFRLGDPVRFLKKVAPLAGGAFILSLLVRRKQKP